MMMNNFLVLASLASHIDRFRLLLVPGINYILFGTLYHLTYIHIHIFVSPSFFTLSQHNGRSTSGDHRFSRHRALFAFAARR
ncbi:hypothetical protein CBS63078_6486 [Aspergillus niger]|nr:hypothetical protein CBS115989_4854 [Aspergillus niger]KAI2827045.1 hypothetical protein CBS133816_6903 [Aspergillus niger]KAI2859571.1 hypothetical protein CBS11232_2032 [Aspergillus niger]KAI2882237.1 hypothetical protein CBS115988_164 [Aspergillus niger]KAI2885540.1 hypothetical protein CBS13152_7445 [Aspergillus niger]